MQVLGLCRFSYPTHDATGFRRRADLYDAARLDRRLRLFETICLPPLRAQTDKDFRLLVLIGEGLPAPARARLQALIAGIREITLCVEPEGQPHLQVCRRVLTRHIAPDAAATAQFCMDDDDAVAIDFVHRLRLRIAEARPIWSLRLPVEIDFHNGFALRLSDPQPLLALSAAHWTPAQAIVIPRGRSRSLFDYNHARFWRTNASFGCPDPQMYVRCFHNDGDNRVAPATIAAMATEVQPSDPGATLRRRFAIDPASLSALYLPAAQAGSALTQP